jgi:two-component system chemotaxis response regulator CheY
MRALVVDDSRAMRMILSRMLDRLGFEVDEAADGPAGLDYLGSGVVPDLMLVDWHMPVMEGIDFVKAVRHADVNYPGKIMMVTTETEAAQIMNALDAGADEYLMKPFTRESLEEKLLILGLGE